LLFAGVSGNLIPAKSEGWLILWEYLCMLVVLILFSGTDIWN
jgi:hypothetical protein